MERFIGVTAKGIFVRVTNPPAPIPPCEGEQGVDVRDRITVTLIKADARLDFIDFARV